MSLELSVAFDMSLAFLDMLLTTAGPRANPRPEITVHLETPVPTDTDDFDVGETFQKRGPEVGHQAPLEVVPHFQRLTPGIKVAVGIDVYSLYQVLVRREYRECIGSG